MMLYLFLNFCVVAPKILSKEELGELPYFSSYKMLNQILRHLVPALGLCLVLLLQSWYRSGCTMTMDMLSAECPQMRGLLCCCFRITWLIVHHQPMELEIPE